jgi:hypothetical protein
LTLSVGKGFKSHVETLLPILIYIDPAKLQTFAGFFMSAPSPEYMISGSYSADRLRGARPKGSPRRLAVAGHDVSSSIFPEFVKLLDRL